MGCYDPKVGSGPLPALPGSCYSVELDGDSFHIQIPSSPASYPALYGIGCDWSFISVSVSGKVFTEEQNGQ